MNLAVDQVVGVMHRLFSSAWGPRTDDVLRAALLTLRQHRGASLTQVPRLFTDPLYRAPLVAAVSDPVLRGFWRQYDTMSEGARVAAIGPVTNKLRAFLLRPCVRAVVGSGTSSFSLDDVLDSGLLLCRFPKGILGDETVRLIGRSSSPRSGRPQPPAHRLEGREHPPPSTSTSARTSSTGGGHEVDLTRRCDDDLGADIADRDLEVLRVDRAVPVPSSSPRRRDRSQRRVR